jgi:hypothetical protein
MLSKRKNLNSGLRRVFVAVFFVLTMLAPSIARAEIVNNFGVLADSKLTKSASMALTRAATLVIAAVNVAEGDREKADSQMKAAVAQLTEARQLFLEIQKQVGSVPINVEKVGLPYGQLQQMAKSYGVEMPKTADGLARLALSEVERFLAAAQQMSFGTVEKARAGTLSAAMAVKRLYDLGVMISALADGAGANQPEQKR